MNSLSTSAHETMHLSNALANVFGHTSGYLRIEWHTVPMVSSEVRWLFNHLLLLMREEHLYRVFTERTTAPPLSAEDCHWIARHWIPQAAREAGLTHCAVVESKEEVDSRTSRLANLDCSGHRLQFRYFDSFTQAEAWIREAA